MRWARVEILTGVALPDARSAFHFERAQLRRQAVEHRVHVLVAVGAAEFLGEFDALVEHHAPRHVGAVLELVHADPHHGVLDGRDFFELAVQQRADQRVELLGAFDRAVQQRVVVRGVGLVEAGKVAREMVDVGRVVVAHQVLVERLQRELACAAAVGLGRSLACAGAGEPDARLARLGAGSREGFQRLGGVFGHERVASSCAISTATRAASRPLSVCRATACSRFSVVMIALAMGSGSRATRGSRSRPIRWPPARSGRSRRE
jgi:hypothetical protein